MRNIIRQIVVALTTIAVIVVNGLANALIGNESRVRAVMDIVRRRADSELSVYGRRLAAPVHTGRASRQAAVR